MVSNSKQKEIVAKIMNEIEIMDEKEFEALYNQLDIDHQMFVDGAIRKFADFAVDSEHGDSDKWNSICIMEYWNPNPLINDINSGGSMETNFI